MASTPKLELGAQLPAKVLPNGVRLEQVAMVQPGRPDLYRLHPDASTGSALGKICTTPKK